MKFQTQINVVGMKSSKGSMDNGNPFDSCKIYALIDMDTSKGNTRGQGIAEYNIGKSDEFSKYSHLPFPFLADADVEILTNGSTQKTVVTGLRPVARVKV